MNLSRPWLALAIVPWFVIVGAGLATIADEPPPLPVKDEELLDELKSAPTKNVEREHKLRDLYLQAGANEDDIALQEVTTKDTNTPALHNVVVTLKGETDDVIVVGGHLDKVSVGRGI